MGVPPKSFILNHFNMIFHEINNPATYIIYLYPEGPFFAAAALRYHWHFVVHQVALQSHPRREQLAVWAPRRSILVNSPMDVVPRCGTNGANKLQSG